jgi:hypothetical protein
MYYIPVAPKLGKWPGGHSLALLGKGSRKIPISEVNLACLLASLKFGRRNLVPCRRLPIFIFHSTAAVAAAAAKLTRACVKVSHRKNWTEEQEL